MENNSLKETAAMRDWQEKQQNLGRAWSDEEVVAIKVLVPVVISRATYQGGHIENGTVGDLQRTGTSEEKEQAREILGSFSAVRRTAIGKAVGAIVSAYVGAVVEEQRGKSQQALRNRAKVGIPGQAFGRYGVDPRDIEDRRDDS